MLGAMIGDIVGSRFEFDMGNKSKEFELFAPECQFTDDTVMTAAVAEALLDVGKDASVDEIEKAVTSSMQKWGHKYPDAGYGGNFYVWLFSDRFTGPYGSYGNGSAMRVSPAGWLYTDLDRTREVARATANVTHNHPEGIKGAESVAAVIFLARHGWEKADIKQYVTDEFGYDLSRTLDEIRPAYHHVESCQETVPEAMTAFFEGESFEDVLRCAVSLGGDCDTLTDIACAMAEAYYEVPKEINETAREYLTDDIMDVYSRFFEEILRIDRSYNEAFAKAKESAGSIEEILKDLSDEDANSLIRSLIRHSHNVQEKIELKKYIKE